MRETTRRRLGTSQPRPLLQPTKTKCIPLQRVLSNGRGRSENIKLYTKHAPSYIAIDYYLLVNVSRKRLDLVLHIGPD